MKNRLAEILKEKGMSQTQLGMASGLGETAISKIINKETDIRMSTAKKIAKALNMGVEEIFFINFYEPETIVKS